MTYLHHLEWNNHGGKNASYVWVHFSVSILNIFLKTHTQWWFKVEDLRSWWWRIYYLMHLAIN